MHIGLRNTLFEGPLQISSSQTRTIGCDDISIAEVEQLQRSKIVFTINFVADILNEDLHENSMFGLSYKRNHLSMRVEHRNSLEPESEKKIGYY